MRAVCDELDSQRTKIDRADDLDMMVIKVPFRRGHLVPRAVRISTETETIPRTEAIVESIRDELAQHSQALEGSRVRSLKLMCYFEGDAWAPVEVVVYPEFRSRDRRSKRTSSQSK